MQAPVVLPRHPLHIGRAPKRLKEPSWRRDAEGSFLHLQGAELKRHVDATLGRGNVFEAVRLPEGEDIREWLAVNTVDMYNAISVLYVALGEFCTDERCKTMSAGPKVCSMDSRGQHERRKGQRG